MTIDYKIVSDKERMTAARIIYDEKIIELGCNMEELNKVIHTNKVWPFYNQFKNMEEYYEKYIDGVITHEVIHDVLYSFDGWDTSHSFNQLDNNHEISQSL